MKGFEVVEAMDREELLEYVRSLLWQFRLVDAFWFIKAEERFGLAAAEKLNEEVWAKVGELAAKDIVRRFGPFEPGLEGFLRAYALFPWTLMVDYEVEKDPQGLLVGVARCPAQEGRLRHGLGEYACRDMHLAEFSGFARVLDPRIRVDCVYAPPDEHPPDRHCLWRFTLEPDPG
ncbi:MAG: DUF6125 family protein [Desulfovibrionaceae bacterium]|nr:DUF6125 family protein [Desulfovibrionaceae bacterium]